MRHTGTSREVTGLGAHDHVSWPYEDRADFCRHAREFLAEGLTLGLRTIYLGSASVDSLKADLADMPGLEQALARGSLSLAVLGGMYGAGEPIDPYRTLKVFATATEEALARGYSGLRVAADATALLCNPAQVAAFATWEHQADRYMSRQPFSAMCGFDRRHVVGRNATALACMHPTAPADVAPFRLYAPDTDAHLALAGELDCTVAVDFTTSLERTDLDISGELVVDGTGLRFLDHRALISLRDFAVRAGTTAVLRTNSALPARLVGLLGLDHIRVDQCLALEVSA